MYKNPMLLAAFCTVFMLSCKQKEASESKRNVYIITRPLQMDTTLTKEYVAQIQSIKNIEVRALERGYLQNISVDEGKFVKAGQVMFRIMPQMYQAELFGANAKVKALELEMMNTRILAEKNIVSKSELAIAKAKLDEAKAEQAIAKLHVAFTTIKAPFDGVIDRIRFRLGSLIDEGGLLTTLSDNRSIYAYFNVSETEYLNYRKHYGTSTGQTVKLQLANGDLFGELGIIETIEGEFDAETGNIAFRAKFPNNNQLLKHGQTGKILMTVPLLSALIIPQKATYELQDKVFVFVVDKNGTVKARNINVAARLSNLYVVDTGLTDQDQILYEGVQTVNDGDHIQTKYADPASIFKSLQLIK